MLRKHENGRSMNAEIVGTLLYKYPEPAVLVTDAAMEDIVDMVLNDGVPRKIERGEKTITVVLQSDGTVITTTSLAPETYELSQIKR